MDVTGGISRDYITDGVNYAHVTYVSEYHGGPILKVAVRAMLRDVYHTLDTLEVIQHLKNYTSLL